MRRTHGSSSSHSNGLNLTCWGRQQNKRLAGNPIFRRDTARTLRLAISVFTAVTLSQVQRLTPEPAQGGTRSKALPESLGRRHRGRSVVPSAEQVRWVGGEAFQNSALDKDDAVPMGEQSMRGSCDGLGGVYEVTTAAP
jgi:hypothetical protein